MCLPSGDQAGAMHSNKRLVKRCTSSLPTLFTYSPTPVGPKGLPVQENATREPSGERAGISAEPGSVVTGTGVRNRAGVCFWREPRYRVTVKRHAPPITAKKSGVRQPKCQKVVRCATVPLDG